MTASVFSNSPDRTGRLQLWLGERTGQHRGALTMGKKLEDKDRTNSPRKLHLLFAGELSDAPMRYESWKDYLVYFGRNTWRITTVEGNEVTRHPIMSTTKLVQWVLDGDQRMEDSAVQNDPDDEPEYKLSFGPFSSRLYEIAKEEHAHHCISCLERWRSGEPVRRKKNLRFASSPSRA